MRLPPGYEPALFLFTPRGEKLWADGWDPLFPAPADDDTEPGTVFETLHGQQRTTWVVCARDPGRSVRYARIAHGRDAGTVTVTLDDAGAATVDYDLTALTGEAAAGLARFAAGIRSTCGTGKRRSPTPPAPRMPPGLPRIRNRIMPDDGPGLFTIGHSNQALGHFLGLLQRHGIEAVADVRTVPWSRYVPQFNARALRAALASRAIATSRSAANSAAARGDEFYDAEGRVLLAGSPRARHSRTGSTRYWPGPGLPHRPALQRGGSRPVPPPPAHRAGTAGAGVGLSHVRRDGRIQTEAELAAREASHGPQDTLFDGDGPVDIPGPVRKPAAVRLNPDAGLPPPAPGRVRERGSTPIIAMMSRSAGGRRGTPPAQTQRRKDERWDS